MGGTAWSEHSNPSKVSEGTQQLKQAIPGPNVAMDAESVKMCRPLCSLPFGALSAKHSSVGCKGWCCLEETCLNSHTGRQFKITPPHHSKPWLHSIERLSKVTPYLKEQSYSQNSQQVKSQEAKARKLLGNAPGLTPDKASSERLLW